MRHKQNKFLNNAICTNSTQQPSQSDLPWSTIPYTLCLARNELAQAWLKIWHLKREIWFSYTDDDGLFSETHLVRTNSVCEHNHFSIQSVHNNLPTVTSLAGNRSSPSVTRLHEGANKIRIAGMFNFIVLTVRNTKFGLLVYKTILITLNVQKFNYRFKFIVTKNTYEHLLISFWNFI